MLYLVLPMGEEIQVIGLLVPFLWGLLGLLVGLGAGNLGWSSCNINNLNYENFTSLRAIYCCYCYLLSIIHNQRNWKLIELFIVPIKSFQTPRINHNSFLINQNYQIKTSHNHKLCPEQTVYCYCYALILYILCIRSVDLIEKIKIFLKILKFGIIACFCPLNLKFQWGRFCL